MEQITLKKGTVLKIADLELTLVKDTTFDTNAVSEQALVELTVGAKLGNDIILDEGKSIGTGGKLIVEETKPKADSKTSSKKK